MGPLGGPLRSELFQVLIPPSSQAPTPSFQFRVSRYPAIGKGPALKTLLEERTKAMQSHGFRMLSVQMFVSEGRTSSSTLPNYPSTTKYLLPVFAASVFDKA